MPTADPDTATMRVVVADLDANTTMDGEKFIDHIVRETRFRTFDVPDNDPASYASLAKAGLSQFLSSKQSAFVWMSVKRDGQLLGRIVFQLFTNICPKTCENFIHLCRGDLPDVITEKGEKIKLHYKGSSFFRVVRNGWIQAGDISGAKNGTGGWSVFGRHFPDESFAVQHDAKGMLGMANDGEHTNSSSFYITAGKSSWMNRRYVAFGRVVEGLTIVQLIHGTPTRHNQTPQQSIVIDDCGAVSNAV